MGEEPVIGRVSDPCAVAVFANVLLVAACAPAGVPSGSSSSTSATSVLPKRCPTVIGLWACSHRQLVGSRMRFFKWLLAWWLGLITVAVLVALILVAVFVVALVTSST